MRLAVLWVLCFAALFGAAWALEARAPTDCSAREQAYGDPRWKCKPASRWADGCVPASEFSTWSCLELDVDARLCESERAFNMTVYLTTDDVSLDCNDQVIDHGWPISGKRRHPAIRARYTRSVSNVNVSHCTLRHIGRYGIDLKRFFRGKQLHTEMRGHAQLTVRDIRIEHTPQWGIYVGQNSRDVHIEDVSIDDAYAGIYIEAGSVGTRIERATIVNSTTREGVAVDSSSHTLIADSTFRGNGDAIKAYKNCGERKGQVCPIARPMDASYVTLLRNRFEGDSVQLASRQHKLYGTLWCDGIGFLGFWRDRVPYSHIEGNRFVDGADLIVADGPTTIVHNDFGTGSVLKVGSDQPGLFNWMGDPVAIRGRVEANVFQPGARFEYATDDEELFDHLRICGNTVAGGKPAAFDSCREL